MLADEERDELDEGPAGSWRLAIWGSGPSDPSVGSIRGSADWSGRGGEIWGRHGAPPPPAPAAPPVPLLPLVELIPAPVEDIIPMPRDLPVAPVEDGFWGDPEPAFEPSRQDIWTGRHEDRTRFTLPQTWVAARKRRSLLHRWLGAD